MYKMIFYFSSFFGFIFLISCSTSKTTLETYAFKDDQYVSGNITQKEYESLKSFLLRKSKDNLMDTIFIKYDFNNEECWMALNDKGKYDTRTVLNSHKKMVASFRQRRPSVSLFEFREKGKNLSNLVKWNKEILIDSTQELFKAVVKEKAMCGISMMIFPDKSYLKIRTDPHMDMLAMTAEQIQSKMKNGYQ